MQPFIVKSSTIILLSCKDLEFSTTIPSNMGELFSFCSAKGKVLEYNFKIDLKIQLSYQLHPITYNIDCCSPIFKFSSKHPCKFNSKDFSRLWSQPNPKIPSSTFRSNLKPNPVHLLPRTHPPRKKKGEKEKTYLELERERGQNDGALLLKDLPYVVASSCHQRQNYRSPHPSSSCLFGGSNQETTNRMT